MADLSLLESSRHGASIDALASELDVTTRTIRRDPAALQGTGFPLYDELRRRTSSAGSRRTGVKGLEAGFTLSEWATSIPEPESAGW